MIKTARGTEVGLGPGHIVLDGGPAPQPRKGVCMKMPPAHLPISPQFSAQVYCGQTVAWIKMPLGTEVVFGPDDIVLDRDTAPLPKKGVEPHPHFSAHVYCGQTAVCIRIPLGTEVGLSLGDIVLDGDPAPLP